MAFFRDPGEMFLGCLGTVEQRYLVNLIKNAAKNGYTRFVEPCAGTFAMDKMGQLHPKDDDEMDPEEDTYL